MMVFIRPTGAPLGIGVTLGFGPNGSAASLDTAPVNTTPVTGDYVLIQSGGLLAKMAAANLIPAAMTAWLAALPTSPASVAVGGWWNNGGVPTQVLS